MTAPNPTPATLLGAPPCVWMSAGLVAYKLCDRGFRCDACPLDLALRGPVSERGGPPRRSPAPAAAWPADRLYHPGHTWAQEVGPGQVRVGIDVFAAKLVGWARAAILPAVGSSVHAGRVGAWLTAHGEPVPLRMPVSGSVAAQNPLVRAHPGLAVEAPLGDGWFALISCADSGSALAALESAEEAERRAAADLSRFAAAARQRLERGRNPVGPTMADGGVVVGDLRRAVGEALWRELVVEAVSDHDD